MSGPDGREPISLLAVAGLGEIGPGEDLAAAIVAAERLQPGDVVCISQKVVSKSEDRVRDLDRVAPSPAARELADRLDKDPALVELILAESSRVVRAERGVLITETNSGLVCANAGIDSSNVEGERRVALLPADPDRSARGLRAGLRELTGFAPAVLISDSFGRPWRIGQTEVAIGCAGLVPVDDWRGRSDQHGRELMATAIAIADELASAADLARDKTAGLPVVVVRGCGRHVVAADGPGAAAMLRAADEDLFR